MKAYYSALIDRSATSENAKLSKKLSSTLKRNLKTHTFDIQRKEFNTFIFLSVDKQGQESVDLKTVELTQEKMQKKFYDVQNSSFASIWNLNEDHALQIYLSASPNQIFELPQIQQQTDLEAMVDKVSFLTFFSTFLDPTLKRLKDMNEVLERLRLGLEGTHFKSSDKETQNKLEMFLRILSAKLSALQNLDKVILSIFKLFNEVNDYFNKTNIVENADGLATVFEEISQKIAEGRTIVAEVQEKLDECLLALKDYPDETKNVVKTVSSENEFKLALLKMAEL